MNTAQIVFDIKELRSKIIELARTVKTYDVWEGDDKTINYYLEIGKLKDIVNYSAYNQLGCVKYEIRLDKNKNKYLHSIWSAEDEYNNYEIAYELNY